MKGVEMPCLISLGQIAFTRDALHVDFMVQHAE